MKFKKGNIRYRFFIIPALFFIISCNPFMLPEQRSRRAAKAKGDIVIGVVQTSVFSNFFLEGINLAVGEINDQGGILGRKIRTIIYDDMQDPVIGEQVAIKLANNADVVAVVGHVNSITAIPASVIYEKTGITFISYGAKDPDMTRYSGNFTFRNIPTQKDFGYQMARFSHAAKLKKTVVFYERGASHQSLADIFKEKATAMGIEIIVTRSYFNWADDFKEMIAQLKKEYEFDSVLISGTMPTAAKLVKQLREMGVTVPIIGGDGLDSSDLYAIAGRASEGLIVPTVFYPEYPNKLTRDFVRRFQSKYDLTPDTWAAQGYDAISLIAHAIEESGSAVPIVISTTLRFLEKWSGITGSYGFVPEGDIVGKEIFFKKMRKGEFVFIDKGKAYEGDLFNYIKEFTLRLPLNEPITTLDPGLAKNESDIEVAEQLFMGLTGLAPKTYIPVPELAKDWKTSRINDLVYIFNLREDAVWTNGEPITGDDVLSTILHHLDPDKKNPHARDLFVLKNAEAIYNGEDREVGVYVPSESMVVFKLEYPAPYFPALVSLPAYRPLPVSVIKQYEDKWTNIDYIQTSGPYKPVLWEKDKGIFLKKNPDYFDVKNVAIPEVRYYIIPQSSVGLAMYENDELDIMGSSYLRLPSADIPRIKKDPLLKKEFFEAPHFCTYAYAFNVRRPPVDNVLVRKAISAAIDRHLLIDVVVEGDGEVATTCTRPPLFGAVPTEDGVGIGFDPSQAREWLAEAGYPGGKNFPEITILYRKSKFHEKIAKGIQSFLQRHLNIPVKIRGENRKDFGATVTEGNPPHIFRTKLCSDYPDADSNLRLFDPSDSYYQTGWENQEYTKLIRSARHTSDENQRELLYRMAEAILCQNEVVVIPFYFEIYHSLVKSRIKGWSHMAMGGQQLHNWRFEK